MNYGGNITAGYSATINTTYTIQQSTSSRAEEASRPTSSAMTSRSSHGRSPAARGLPSDQSDGAVSFADTLKNSTVESGSGVRHTGAGFTEGESSMPATTGLGSLARRDISIYERKQHVKTSAVDDYISRHPDARYQLERFVRAGENVLKVRGAQYKDVDSMSMDEYKAYIKDVIDSVPFDSSQARDTQILDITEEGWEQMKNDPKYEAWVVGYFKIDRAVKMPFANYPGVGPSIHSEHFGASIDEHIGTSYPSSTENAGKDSKDWWQKRKERYERYLEESQELAQERSQRMERAKGNHAWRTMIARGSGNVFGEMNMFEGEGISAAASFFAMIAQGSGGESAGK